MAKKKIKEEAITPTPIMQMILDGLEPQDIAARLNLDFNTISNIIPLVKQLYYMQMDLHVIKHFVPDKEKIRDQIVKTVLVDHLFSSDPKERFRAVLFLDKKYPDRIKTIIGEWIKEQIKTRPQEPMQEVAAVEADSKRYEIIKQINNFRQQKKESKPCP